MKKVLAVIVVLSLGVVLSACPVKYQDGDRKVTAWDRKTLEVAANAPIPDVPERAENLATTFQAVNPHANFRIHRGTVEYEGTPARPENSLQQGLIHLQEDNLCRVVILNSNNLVEFDRRLEAKSQAEHNLLPGRYVVVASRISDGRTVRVPFEVDSMPANVRYNGLTYDWMVEIYNF